MRQRHKPPDSGKKRKAPCYQHEAFNDKRTGGALFATVTYGHCITNPNKINIFYWYFIKLPLPYSKPESLDPLMSLAVALADARPDHRAYYLRVWSSLKNTQRKAEGLPILAGLPAASAGELARFVREVGLLEEGVGQ